MATNLIIGVRFLTNSLQRIKIENVLLDNKARELKERTSQQIGKPTEQIDLMYAGLILDDDQPLKSYGITPGVMVHVLQKSLPKEVVNTVTPKKPTETEIQQLVSAIRLTLKKGLALRLTNADEIRTEVFAQLPADCRDPVARAIVLDPHLYQLLANAPVLRQVSARHPDIVPVARALATFVHKRQLAQAQSGGGGSGGGAAGGSGGGGGRHSHSGGRGANSAGAPGGRFSIFEDEDVDIEDVDADVDGDNDEDAPPPASGGHSGGYGLARNASFNAITAAQLANAIANATHLTTRSGLASTPRAVLTTTAADAANSSLITSEMFSGALQQAFSNLPTSGTGSPPPGQHRIVNTFPETSESVAAAPEAALRTRLQPQLMQMHELGLLDDGVNIRALQASAGDVQAAIDLVFNHVVD